MPPFLLVRRKAVALHEIAQKAAMHGRCGGRSRVEVGQHVHAIVGRAHVDRSIVTLIRRIAAPRHKIVHGTLRTIAVEHPQAERKILELALDRRKGKRGRLCEDACGGMVPTDRTADEVVTSGIPDVLNDRRRNVGKIDESVR